MTMGRRFFFFSFMMLLLVQICSMYMAELVSDSGAANQPSYAKGEKINNADLAKWKIMGGGTVTMDAAEKALRITESRDSKGVTLVSPKAYPGNVTLTFKVKPEKHDGVCVIILSASDKNAPSLKIPSDNDGSLPWWSEGSIQNYMIAFHTGFHQPNIFIRKNPGSKDIIQTLDIATEQKWYTIEIGQKGPRLWLKVDGKTAVEGTDPDGKGLPGGNIGIRLRGPGDGSYSCLFRDMEIRTE
jgi:hypothetical protein